MSLDDVTDTSVRCPYCGRVDRDVWEVSEPPGEPEECGCGGKYEIVEIEPVRYYTVRPVSPPPSPSPPEEKP